MKRDQQTVNDRHNRMLAIVRERKEVTVEELASLFDVSLMTVRRDLQALEDKGLLARFHGGATIEKTKGSADRDLPAYRDAISRYAADLVDDEDYLFINGSMTSLDLLRHIGDKHVHVYTNNGNAVNLDLPDNVTLTLTGGTVRGKNRLMTGDYALRNLLTTHADKAFIGCTGISPAGEILCGVPSELAINESMISHAFEYYILADFTKIGQTGTYASFSLEKKGTVITDSNAPRNVLEQLEKIGMKVIVVDDDQQEPVIEA